MPLTKSYVVWNNKGGVGKSTIVFNVAARYAQQNPAQKVLVIDMCPQANVTMMLLGGGENGEAELLKLQSATHPKTIVGYISDQIDRISGRPPAARRYDVNVKKRNPAMPANLRLVAGDGNLELLAPAISYYANAQFPIDIWERVHLWIKELVEQITNTEDEWVVFIDTNPAFSIYTELAVVAAQRLLVPYKADDSSRVAVRAMLHLLWGATPPHPVYGNYTFASKAKAAKLKLPLCHLFVGNQFKQYVGAARAFRAMSAGVVEDIYGHYKGAPIRYTPRATNIATAKKFSSEYIFELRDFNTTGVVAAHQGRLVSDLTEGNYVVYGENVPVDKRRMQDCTDAVDELVALL